MTEKEKQDYIEINKILDDIDKKHEKEIEEKIKKSELIPIKILNNNDFGNENIKTLMIKAFIIKYKNRIDMSKIKEIKDIFNFFASDEFDRIKREDNGHR